MNQIETAIIIVNWNGVEHIEVCLNSVFKQMYKQFVVFLVDNNSSDNSVEYVQNNFPQVKVIRCHKNHGFAEGNNIGIKEAFKMERIKYVATLNNDTEVDPNWLTELVFLATSDELIGAVSSKMLMFNNRNIIDSSGDFLYPDSLKVVTRGNGQKDIGQYDKVEECFSARAGAALYKRKMLEEVCLLGDYFDRKYFAYIEDSDLSIRARFYGWKIMYAPKAVVYHKAEATSSKISKLFRIYHSGRNKIFTSIKNYPIKWWPLALQKIPSNPNNYKLTFFDNLFMFTRSFFAVVISLPRLLRQRKIIFSKRKISSSEIKDWTTNFS